jgi:hypothetical protein
LKQRYCTSRVLVTCLHLSSFQLIYSGKVNNYNCYGNEYSVVQQGTLTKLLCFALYLMNATFLFSPVALQSFKDIGRLTYGRFLELFRHVVGFLGRVINPSQGLYLHRTTQHRKTRTNIHALGGIRTHDPRNQPAKTHASDRTATVAGEGYRHTVFKENSLYYVKAVFLTLSIVYISITVIDFYCCHSPKNSTSLFPDCIIPTFFCVLNKFLYLICDWQSIKSLLEADVIDWLSITSCFHIRTYKCD